MLSGTSRTVANFHISQETTKGFYPPKHTTNSKAQVHDWSFIHLLFWLSKTKGLPPPWMQSAMQANSCSCEWDAKPQTGSFGGPTLCHMVKSPWASARAQSHAEICAAWYKCIYSSSVRQNCLWFLLHDSQLECWTDQSKTNSPWDLTKTEQNTK